MSYHVFFSLSSSFGATLRVPKGTLAGIWERIKSTEEVLGLKRTPTYTPEGETQRPGWRWANAAADMLARAGSKAGSNTPQWWLADRERDAFIGRMATALRAHNAFVRRLYSDLSAWAKRTTWKSGESERITVAQSVEFWGGLQIIELPKEIWTRDHFTDYMEHLHALLTTGDSRGVSLNCKPFDAKQAGALIGLFEAENDQWGFDARFEIPLDEHLKPYDRIASAYDGGYDWCAHCGPINSDDFHARCRVCPRAKRGKCDLKNESPAELTP